MTPDEHQFASTPDAPPRELPQWEQRLEKALPWYGIFLGVTLTISQAQGKPFNLHPSAMLQRIASIVFVAAFVPYALIGMTLIFRTMRQNPPPNRLYAWGAYLLVAGLLVGLPSGFWLYVEDIAGHISRGHLSSSELLVIVVLLTLTCILCGIGTVLLVAAFIRDLWRLARSLWLGPPSRLRD